MMNSQTTPTGYQFIPWFPEWRGFHFVRLDVPEANLTYIYEWAWHFGFWELQKRSAADHTAYTAADASADSAVARVLRECAIIVRAIYPVP